ncbi:MAG: TIGR00730 family Rossman fold protein [bacterium]|nr:TIGR00730 family Rossman fold protein [bacterium]
MTKARSACVYCGSSNGVSQNYKDSALALGTRFAKEDMTLVYGGGQMGLMGLAADGCMKAGGYVKGYITSFLDEFEKGHEDISELHVTHSMHERKLKMFDNSDAFIAMPGGLGTLDEMFEVITWKQIGLHDKNIVFWNLEGYWSPLLETLLPKIISEGFAREEDLNLYAVADTLDDVMDALHAPPKGAVDFVARWG